MKKILGLDLGTNSIGWAVVEIDHLNKVVKIIALGSRILLMDAGEINTFESGGKLKSLASQRTDSRGIRRQNERFLLRRDRLHCVLNLLEMLPEHYKLSIEFENDKGKRSGKFKDGADVKFAYAYNENGDVEFLFKDAYFEMVSEFREKHPDLFYQKKNKKETKIPYDWTLYYLRKKALTQQVNKEELAWITLSFLQKRGYEKLLGQDEKEQKQNELSEIKTCRASNVTLLGICENGLNKYKVELKDELGNDVFSYIEESNSQITSVNDLKQLEIISGLNEDFEINKTTYTISEIRTLTVVDVKHALDVKNAYKKNKDNFCFDITLSTGWSFEKQSKTFPKWTETSRDFIIKSSYDIKGNLQKRGINAPEADDWSIIKLKVETTLQEYNANHKTVGVGSYIYDSLLENPTQKLKGNRGLINTIERNFYKKELDAILSKQKEFEIHSALKDVERYQKALSILYPHNENRINTLQNSDFQKLLCDDVIFYQRDLKTKKSLIADCLYETENYEKVDKKGNKYKQPLKAVHKSNPYYQEFRLWQFIKRLKIIQLEVESNGNLLLNQDVTGEILTIDKKEALFKFLNNRKEITQGALLKHLKLKPEDYKWNFEADHKEPCNETRYEFILRLKRIKDFPWEKFLSATDKNNGNTNEYYLWHLFYSVKKKDELLKALNNSLINKLLDNAGLDGNKWHDEVVKNLSSFCGYKSDYGSYSEKAIKKLLPFMRVGKYWNKDIVEQILAKSNVEIKEKVFEKEKINGEIEDFQGLWVSSACYIVYGRYSEVGDVEYWRQPSDIINYLQNDFKQHSLRNPIVEKVLRETLLVVHDIWTTYGTCKTELIGGKENKVYDKFFDEIHLELGTELKKNTKEKERKTIENKENRIANERIVEILKELKQEYGEKYINVNSPFQQKKLQILEKDLLDSISKDKDTKIYTDEKGTLKITKKKISEISRKEVSKISVSDIKRYRLWLDQRYISPYTGIPIKLSDLFDREKYEVEHVFPRERVTLNAMCNLVIAEVEVNKAKSNKTAYDFIITGGKNGKRSFKCAAHGKEVVILSKDEYEKKIKEIFIDKAKQEILLSREIPDKFTNSQLNNSRYIAKMAMKLLSNIVREDDEKTFRSKHLLPISGGVTNILKKDWQLDEAWNELISPRFKRLNEITDTELFGSIRNVKGHDVFCPDVPEFMRSDFNKKRIDHRHHALDALIIALATENHVNYINNIHSSDSQQDKLASRIDIKNKYMFSQKNEDGEKDRRFLPPAQYKQNKHDGGELIAYRYVYKDREENPIFKYVVLDALQDIVVTFKQKNRIIWRRTNKYKSWDEEKNEFAFKSEKDLKNTQKYNVRQELHKATLYGRLKEQMSLSNALENVDSIVDNKLREQIVALKQMGYDNGRIKQELGRKYSNVLVYKNEVSTQWQNEIETFAKISKDKIIDVIENDIYDSSVRRILKNHLSNYNSISVPIADVGNFLNDIVYDDQKQEIVKLLNEGVDLSTIPTINIGGKGYKEIEVFVRDRQVSENEEIIYNPQFAFSPDGVEIMNSNIQLLNKGKLHKPIYQVKLKQALGKMFPVSENRDSEKNKRYVVAEAGSNAFCGVYQSKEGERKFIVPSLKENIENLKQGNIPCPEYIFDENNEYHLVFMLSPNDLVYVPTIEELNSSVAISFIDKERIYKFRDASINNKGGVQVNFAPYRYAKLIWQNDKGIVYGEENSQKLKGEITITTDKDKSQNAINENVAGVQIRSRCWKLVVDRLGNIEKIIKG